MRWVIIILLTPCFSFAAEGPKQPRFGIGALFGEPTGFSAELEINREHAIDGAVSYSLVKGALHVHGDYLYRFTGMKKKHDLGWLLPYAGVGAQLALGKKSSGGLSIRIPLGLINFFTKAPVGVFLEIVPGMSVLPDTDFVMGAAIGVRYYF